MFWAEAQNKTVSGKVVDDKAAPIANASVVVKGTNNGVTTNSEGIFSITIPSANSVLSFSHVNYAPGEIAVGTQTFITFTMQPNDKSLAEVVVTALGISK